MQNIFYIIAFLLILFWGVGFFVYSLGAIIHLLLIIAVVAVVLTMMRRGRDETRDDRAAHDPKSAPP